MQPGLGAVLSALYKCGYEYEKETNKAFAEAVGKEISALAITDNALVFRFTDRTGLTLFDAGQCCCEARWMHTDDELADFVGAKLLHAEVHEGPLEDQPSRDVRESQFLVIGTSIGQFTVVNYNEHNGYYAGFSLRAIYWP